MWRYLAGGVAAMLMVAAGWLIFGSSARPEPLLPARPAVSPTAPAAQARKTATVRPLPRPTCGLG